MNFRKKKTKYYIVMNKGYINVIPHYYYRDDTWSNMMLKFGYTQEDVRTKLSFSGFDSEAEAWVVVNKIKSLLEIYNSEID